MPIVHVAAVIFFHPDKYRKGNYLTKALLILNGTRVISSTRGNVERDNA